MDIHVLQQDVKDALIRKQRESFSSLVQEKRNNIPTEAAAYHLGRKPQTLRAWACFENGPIRPLRIYGRLAWPVAEIKRLLGVGDHE